MVIRLRESLFRSPGLLLHSQELFLVEVLSLLLDFLLDIGVDQLLDVFLKLVILLVLLKYNQDLSCLCSLSGLSYQLLGSD